LPSIRILGGIDEQRLDAAASLGFKGAAALGAIWQAPDPMAAAGRLWAICLKSTPAQEGGHIPPDSP
jgi:thiamine-phosphate pyrophosphorylase